MNRPRPHSPIGIGVQGLADAFIKMRYPFETSQAMQLNRDIFETMYFGAVEASMEVAMKDGPYSTYEGSPISQGVFQFDMWGVTPSSGRWDWQGLREKVVKHGVRNSLLLAPMPTASTAQILGKCLLRAACDEFSSAVVAAPDRPTARTHRQEGSAHPCTKQQPGNNESVEPFTSNMYSRRVLAGEFTVVNKYLLRDLIDRGLWTQEVRNQIMHDGGSVQGVQGMPRDLKDLYKTVWEIKQKCVIDQAADRGAYICQSQSLNIHLASPTPAQLTSMHFYSWKKGLKTGMYYLRTRPKADAIQFTVDKSTVNQAPKNAAAEVVEEEEEEDEGCLNCGA